MLWELADVWPIQILPALHVNRSKVPREQSLGTAEVLKVGLLLCPKHWPFFSPPFPCWLVPPCPAQLKVKRKQEKSAPEGDHLPKPYYCKLPRSSSNLTPPWVPSTFLTSHGSPSGLNMGGVCLNPPMLEPGKMTAAGLGKPQRCSYWWTVCRSHHSVALQKANPAPFESLQGNSVDRGRVGRLH